MLSTSVFSFYCNIFKFMPFKPHQIVVSKINTSNLDKLENFCVFIKS